MKNNNTPKIQNKSIKELEAERDKLESQIEQYLLVLGADHMLLKEIIDDLKSQMCMHADATVNNMIADLINLENQISIKKERQKINKAYVDDGCMPSK